VRRGRQCPIVLGCRNRDDALVVGHLSDLVHLSARRSPCIVGRRFTNFGLRGGDDRQAVVFAMVSRVNGSPHLGVRVTFRVVFGHTEGYKAMPRRQSLLLVAFADSSPPCPASTANVSNPPPFPLHDAVGTRETNQDPRVEVSKQTNTHNDCREEAAISFALPCQCYAVRLTAVRPFARLNVDRATRLHPGCCCCGDVLLRWFTRYVTDPSVFSIACVRSVKVSDEHLRLALPP
jgi:hypothetical protein